MATSTDNKRNNDAPATTFTYEADAVPSWTGTSSDGQDHISGSVVTWSASEYVHHEKTSSWYVTLGLVALPLIVGIYFFTGRDIVAVIASVIIVVVFGLGATRAPRSLEYKIDDHGIMIGSRHFSFNAFKSFSVTDENALQTVVLAPLKRFLPPLSLYCPPEQADSIINTISQYLPFVPKSDDPIDMLMRKLRF